MRISLEDTQQTVLDIAFKCKDQDAKRKLYDLDLKLIATRSASRDDHSWDIPSLIVGALGATAISLLFCSGSVHADSLDLNLTSIHADNSLPYNNKNYGIGYTHDLNHHWQIKGGGYRNSYDKNSLYAMIKLKHDMKDWRWGVQFGFVTGYDNIESSNVMQSQNVNGQKTSTRTSHNEHNYGNQVSKQGQNQSAYSGAKNKDKFQFLIMPTATYKFTKQHAIETGCIPGFESGNICDVITFQYQYTMGD